MSMGPNSTAVGVDKIQFIIREDTPDAVSKGSNASRTDSQRSTKVNTNDGAGQDEFMPLMSSKMANIGPGPASTHNSDEHDENVLTRTPKDQKPENAADINELLGRLKEQQRLIAKQREALERKDQELHLAKNDPRSGHDNYSGSVTTSQGTTDSNLQMSYTDNMSPDSLDDNRYQLHNAHMTKGQKLQEFNRLQNELKAAQNKISAMNEELIQTRITKHTIDQALSQSGDDNIGLEDVSEHTLTALRNKFAQLPRPNAHRADTWPTPGYDESTGSSIDYRDGVNAAGPFSGASNSIWGNSSKNLGQNTGMPVIGANGDIQLQPAVRRGPMEPSELYGAPTRVWNNQGHRNFTSQPLAPGQGDARFFGRRASYNPGALPFTSGLDRVSVPAQFGPNPVGTPLAPQNPVDIVTGTGPNIWAPNVPQGVIPPQTLQPGQTTYVSTMEPLNYRRLLERSVNCNWKYIVDKIVCSNDQQASIFLQQKLKIGTADQKHAIVDSIVAQAYNLMINRFGNFLVQRCFEHGTPEQIQGIANAIRGNTVVLSMDAFGCHVIQKAFDCVPEDFKATMVSELLRRIPETVIHRYACHVWQKLFELRWTGTPPQIMKYVNEALRGMWHEVALGETGSLVVQNIFENCLEADKRPCINEVLEYIDLIAHGQFGNWCIQHICEHGAPMDRSRAIDVVIANAAEYSMDQYASKVVEKCLKIGGNEFLDRYLDRVCEGRPDRPRIPLIDIASDQYGNYLVQWILQHASMPHREQVASHIRKHMVSLRGSKFGSRVGMLCCNPIYNRQVHGPPSPTSRFPRFGFR